MTLQQILERVGRDSGCTEAEIRNAAFATRVSYPGLLDRELPSDWIESIYADCMERMRTKDPKKCLQEIQHLNSLQ
jgi:hypothetical protein